MAKKVVHFQQFAFSGYMLHPVKGTVQKTASWGEVTCKLCLQKKHKTV